MLIHTIFMANTPREHDKFVGRYPRAAQYVTPEHEIGDFWIDMALN